MKYILILIIISFSLDFNAQIVNIPDLGFKQFLIQEGIDINGDTEIQISEAEAVENMSINSISFEINSIEGIKAFVNLNTLEIDYISVDTVDVSGLEKLVTLSISSDKILSLIAMDCIALKTVQIVDQEFLSLIDFSGCISLEIIDGSICANIIKLNNCISLNELRFINCNYSLLDLKGCESLTYFEAEVYNSDFSFNFSDVPALETLYLDGFAMFDLDIIDVPSLKNLKLDFISTARVINCPELQEIEFFVAKNIDLFELPKLTVFRADLYDTKLLKIEECPALQSFVTIGDIVDFDVKNCNALESISLNSNIENVIINNCKFLETLNFMKGSNPNLWDFTGLSSLRHVFSTHNGPITLILNGCYNLESFTIKETLATEYDFSPSINLQNLSLNSCFSLESLILKNRSMENLKLNYAPFLVDVCVDLDEQEDVQSYLDSMLDHEVSVTTDCEFASDGVPYSISGKTFLDTNNDSCQTSDISIPFNKYKISNEIIGTRYLLTNDSGLYQYNVPAGQYTFGPELQLGDYIFTSYPENKSVDFPSDGTTVNQDFCFIPNPAEVDIIEVHLIPIDAARPGFDTKYLITYTNTGNITRGGDIKLTFPGDLMDLVSAEPMVDVQEDGFLSWGFEDLIPYETRRIEFTMNLNSPMDTPPLNGGEILNMKAEVGPLGNQTLTVYWSFLNQEIVNSFDPNDKTCLSGNAFDQELVGDYLKYMIRFENTGTAEAVNIVVTDALDDSKFDIHTLQVINASHEVETELTDNVVKFIFRNIYLPFEDATNDGYVTFKIKTLPTLELGDDIRNKAEIFFDFNFPIVTNTTSTIISDFTTVIDHDNFSFDFELSPNPASESILLTSDVPIEEVEILNLDGRVIEKTSLIGSPKYHTLSVAHLKFGVYLIKVKSKSGFSTQKIVIE